jgi:hypothetical protein
MPLYDKNGKFFGVQCIDLALDSINKNITGARLYNSGYAFLIDKKASSALNPLYDQYIPTLYSDFALPIYITTPNFLSD